MISLGISIMAHPERERYVYETMEKLAHPTYVAWDGEGPSSSDRERRWRTGREAWDEGRDTPTDWYLVLQDDVILSEDFVDGAVRALDQVPGAGPVTFYLGRKRPAPTATMTAVRQARQQRASWIMLPRIGWGVAVAIPTAEIPGMLEYCDSVIGMPYDRRIGDYFEYKRKLYTWATWPSIADHRRDTPSLIATQDTGRYAYHFYSGSAASLRWDGPVAVDPRLSGPGARPCRFVRPEYERRSG